MRLAGGHCFVLTSLVLFLLALFLVANQLYLEIFINSFFFLFRLFSS